jgi:multisubunit Na+/H+ antiporter MnhB subunit
MNPLSFITSPATDIAKAVTYPFKMIFVVGICAVVNYMTSPGVWWVQWVVFGMGIGLIAVWFRAAKSIIAAIGVAAIGYFVYRWWKNRGEPNALKRALAEVKPFVNKTAA